jgi:carbamate kinase
MERIVVAIGGNALNQPGQEPSAEMMKKNLLHTTKCIADLIEEGHQIIITHGNGPQVGNLLIQQDISKGEVPPFPIDINDAMTQGSIGYLISQSLKNELQKRNYKKNICCLLTQIVVDKYDEAFMNPRKQVGPFYEEKKAKEIQDKKKWVFKEDSGRGWRRVVPSPQPLEVVELEAAKNLVCSDFVCIVGGGGGIPVIRNINNELEGVEAVIDKDRASALIAKLIDATLFIVLTAVDYAYLNFGKENQSKIENISIDEITELMKEGHFARGSMYPKIESAKKFVEETGKSAIITSLDKVKASIEGKAGTHIYL